MGLRALRGAIVSMLLVAAGLGAETGTETPEQFKRRTQWWREAKFGMFIHWGIYALPADATDFEGKHRIAEWYLSNKQMQVKDYEKFAAQFNPVKFNAKHWVKAAKDAGMKYIVITSKHHDGFCMFDSKLTDYTITKATPYKRDPMKELAEECRRQGLKFCFYHSIMDWHHPDYLPRRAWEKETRPAEGAYLDRYIEYMKGHLRELLSNYGPVGVIWFDGDWEHTVDELRSPEVNALIRSLQPDVIINNRNRLPEDFSTPEQNIPARALPGGRLWETCMTMNDTWGYAKNDTNWKSPEDLIRKLSDIAGKGGNFLLNVGPTAEGQFTPETHERLARLGVWMKFNSPSIYGSTKCPYRSLPFNGRCTVKGNKLYLHVFEWPKEGLTLSGLEPAVLTARALEGGERLKVTQAAGGETGGPQTLSIGQPKQLDPAATVVELSLAGSPRVVEPWPVAKPEADGSFWLKPADAEIHGQTARYDVKGTRDQIGYIDSWTDAKDYVAWTLDLPQSGRHAVEVMYGCPTANQGSLFTVGVEDGAKLSGTVKGTASWTDFRTETLGEIDLPAGKNTLVFRITSIVRRAAMTLRQVRLVPAR